MGLPDVFHAQKVLSVPRSWAPGPNGTLNMLLPLDIDGVTVQGLYLRCRARVDLPDEDVFFQLEYPFPGRRDAALARIEWRPLKGHYNSANAPGGLKLLKIAGSHHHSFALNWFAPEERMRAANLPIAEPIDPDPPDLSALLEFVSKSFRISDLDLISVPPWEKGLL
jgi:hypothetical protein